MQLLSKGLKYDGSILCKLLATIDFLPTLLLPGPLFPILSPHFFCLLNTVHIFGTLKMVSIYFSLICGGEGNLLLLLLLIYNLTVRGRKEDMSWRITVEACYGVI